MKILILGAHPDDELLGCGGTIARLAREGVDVYIAILGEGLTSRTFPESAGSALGVMDLKSRCRRVAELLGARDLYLHDFPDNRFDTLPLLQIIKKVEEVIARCQPDEIYTHHGGDLNIDHSILFRATLTATRPVSKCEVKVIYAYEVPSSTDWAFHGIEPEFRPNCFVDIQSTLDIKIEAMKIYESESRAFPHPRSPEALRAIARNWGRVAGLESAEAFEIIRMVK